MGDNSDMAKKKSINFDFSDISSGVTQVESVDAVKNILEEVKEKVPEKKKSIEPMTGTAIAIPIKNRFMLRDLSECTSAEFEAWIRMYYPCATAGAERFQSVSARVRAFQTIVAWHYSMMFRKIRETMH